jgi:hypothetical protein
MRKTGCATYEKDSGDRRRLTRSQALRQELSGVRFFACRDVFGSATREQFATFDVEAKRRRRNFLRFASSVSANSLRIAS